MYKIPLSIILLLYSNPTIFFTYENLDKSFRYWPSPTKGGAANKNDSPQRNQMCFESQYLLLVRACQVRCKQTTDKYRTIDMPVIVNNELIPKNLNDMSVLIFVSPN